jgi:hypothetical protein
MLAADCAILGIALQCHARHVLQNHVKHVLQNHARHDLQCHARLAAVFTRITWKEKNTFMTVFPKIFKTVLHVCRELNCGYIESYRNCRGEAWLYIDRAQQINLRMST